jgi:hypothetical protein
MKVSWVIIKKENDQSPPQYPKLEKKKNFYYQNKILLKK